MISFDIATFLLQWATGGLAFLWVTTRRREVSIGYGWLMRATFGSIALLALVVGVRYSPLLVRDLSAAGVVLACAAVGWVSWDRRRAGVERQRERVQVRSARVTEMTGIDRAEIRVRHLAPGVPPGARPDRSGHRPGRRRGRRCRPGRTGLAGGRPSGGRRSLPRVRVRRDAAGPLVPDPTGTAAGAARGAGAATSAGSGRSRWRCCWFRPA